MSNPNTYDRLIAVLKLERASLLEGRLDAVEGIKEQRDLLTESLSQQLTDLNLGELEKLQSLSQENNSLYESALEGLGAARARVEGWLEAQSGLTTYNQDRRNVSGDYTRTALEKRA